MSCNYYLWILQYRVEQNYSSGRDRLGFTNIKELMSLQQLDDATLQSIHRPYLDVKPAVHRGKDRVMEQLHSIRQKF